MKKKLIMGVVLIIIVSVIWFAYIRNRKEEAIPEVLLSKAEVQHFLESNPNRAIYTQANNQGLLTVSFHMVGNGAEPLWNQYTIDENQEIIDSFSVYDENGQFVCSKATDDECEYASSIKSR